MALMDKLNELLLRTKLRRFPPLNKALVNKEIVYKVPPLTNEWVKAIKLISPQYNLGPDEKSRTFWEKDQNVSCWAEFEALQQVLTSIPQPSVVLEIGPGFGRSVVFLTKQLHWQNVQFHLYEGTGENITYSLLETRDPSTFCGNIPLLEHALKYNGLKNFQIFDAKNNSQQLANLPNKYDVIYSLYAVGFHWSLEHYIEDILKLMHPGSLAFFIVPNHFVKFDALDKIHYKILRYQPGWPANHTLNMLLISPSDIFSSMNFLVNKDA